MNWLLLLQQAGLPVVTADETIIDGITQVNASFSRPLTPAEVMIYLSITNSTEHRRRQSRVTAKAIPNWATWTQADWDAYFTANLSPAQVTTVTTIATARTMLNRQNLVIQNLVKLVIAMRDNQWPDL
jgi:hypothetical protein